MRFQINRLKPKPILFVGCIAVLVLCVLNPLGLASGSRDFDAYAAIRTLLSETKNAKLLYLASDNDFYEFRAVFESRQEHGEYVALEGSNEIFSEASFGNWSFNKYLNNSRVTHILVPMDSARENKVVRKWGSHGNIAIDLKKPFFVKKLVTSGDLPVAVYEVVRTENSNSQRVEYSLVWDRALSPDFYSQVKNQQEVGLYTYKYESRFRDGATVGWVMADEAGRVENPAFMIQTSHPENPTFLVTIEILAAYGMQAPDQVVTVSAGDVKKSVIVSAGVPGRVVLEVKTGQRIKLMNGLPCRAANTFDADTSDTRRFCFGVSRITVRPTWAD